MQVISSLNFRFNSGFFYKHPLLANYAYYWRVEPGVQFHCDFNYDPFLFMQVNKKKYGFNIALTEIEETIPTLWKTVLAFIRERPDVVTPQRFKDSLHWLSWDHGESYNLCHFWSNFEIASLDFFRGEAYEAFFEYLDKTGGFFYERWGDAPVHSIAVNILLERNEIHFFEDIGYTVSSWL